MPFPSARKILSGRDGLNFFGVAPRSESAMLSFYRCDKALKASEKLNAKTVPLNRIRNGSDRCGRSTGRQPTASRLGNSGGAW